jgi:hypothetical protein
MIDYTACVVKDILIAGIADSDIRKELLSIPDLDDKTDKEIVELVEAKEMALKTWNGTTTSGAAGLSNYRKNQKPTDMTTEETLKDKLAKKGKCNSCAKKI